MYLWKKVKNINTLFLQSVIHTITLLISLIHCEALQYNKLHFL